MDFSVLEGLTEEELKELYNDYIQDIQDPVKIGRCACWTGHGYGFVAFGDGADVPLAGFGFNLCQTYWGPCGNCYLQILSQKDCGEFCKSKGFSGNEYYTMCFCPADYNGPSRRQYVDWTECR